MELNIHIINIFEIEIKETSNLKHFHCHTYVWGLLLKALKL